MKKILISFIALFSLSLFSCKKDWLERQSKSLIVDEQVWNDPKQILSLLANYYDRLPTDLGLQDINDGSDGRLAQWRNMADYDDAMWSGQSNEDGRNNIVSYATSRWALWNYSYIRDINLAIEKITELGTSLDPVQKKQFLAELRFLRAVDYFELVKRMGGVPLVTKQLIYDFKGDPTPLQTPRAKESEVYDFIASEMDAIKIDLGNISTGGLPSYSRANKYTAMAVKSRAMLYAASIAKYNNTAGYASVSTPGGEVGIPASKANEYYQKSLDASKEILNSGAYTLKTNAANPGQAFYEAVTKKLNNREVIFAKDFLSSKNKRHFFTYDNIARSVREDNLGSSTVTPSLNLVESYDYLDGSVGTVKTMNATNTDYIYYDKLEDIFANKDARLYGTVVYPGATFRGLTVEMQAGVMVWNASTNSYNAIEGPALGVNHTDGKLLVGASGPHRSIQEVSNTGFYLRKYIDDGPGTSTRGILSDVWWVWYRLGEIYLNAAEASFELGNTPDALMYINKLRERAGFPANSLTSIDINKIRNERRNELAFEDHRPWDLKRWRIADQVWNGNTTNPNATVFALYPYRVIRPGDPTRDGKYVYVKLKAPRFGAPRFFQIQNYYTFIPQNVLNNNPLIARNPLQ